MLTLAQKLRYAMDERLRADGLTTQQAALITVVAAAGKPSLAEAAAALGSTHQNVAQIVAALVRKELLEVERGPDGQAPQAALDNKPQRRLLETARRG